VYYFFRQDPRDGTLKLFRIGYCDDNTRFITAVTDEELIAAVRQFIKQTGDLSMVLKLGRKGTKCDISFFNLKIESIINLTEFESVAWSFAKDAPLKETIPVKCTIRPEDELKLKVKELSNDDLGKIKKLTKLNNCRHLGLTSDLKANTSASQIEVIKNIKQKINELAIHNMHAEPQKYCINAFLVSVPSFAPLQFNYNLCKLKECDSLISRKIGKSRGLSISDSKHRLYLKNHRLGGGIKSIVDSSILAIARELEVELNGTQISSGATRGRLYAAKDASFNRDITCNHIYDGIIKLSRFGIFLRDSTDGIANYLFKMICDFYKVCPVGDSRFKVKENPAILSKGLVHYDRFAIYNRAHNEACQLAKVMKHNPSKILQLEQDDGGCRLKKWWRDAVAQRKMDYVGDFWYWEWSRNPYCNNPSDENANWTPHLACNKVEDNFFSDNDYLEQQLAWEEVENHITLDIFSPSLMSGSGCKLKRRSFRYIEDVILKSGSPILMATDGGHAEDGDKTTAATVLCILDIREDESIISREWEERPVIPLIARCNILPSHFGIARSDIGHGEAAGLCMQEEMLHPLIPRCVITDSVSMRKRALLFRNEDCTVNRSRVRNVLNGMGKGMGTRMQNRFEDIKIWQKHLSSTELFELNEHLPTLQQRLLEFDSVTKLWSRESARDERHKIWSNEYNDSHNLRKIIKVDSHQLSIDGKSQLSPPRYINLVPNFAIANCNHWADVSADIAMKKNISDINNFPSIVPYKMDIPCSVLRFHFTWNGCCIDKKLTKFLENKLETDRVQRLCGKETQGLVFRMWEFASKSLIDMHANSGWFRAASGFMNCHTRGMYKSIIMRIGLELRKRKVTSKVDDEIQEILENAPSKLVKAIDNLRCSWCNSQVTADISIKNKLGRGLRGNRRHVIFFCQCKELSKARKGLNQLLEKHLWSWLDELEEMGGIMAKAKIIQKINSELERIRNSDLGRLIRSTSARLNYLSIEGWLKLVHKDSIYDCRKDDAIILLNIFGFGTALADGELEDKHMGVVDSMYMGIIPNSISHLINSEVKEICSSIQDAGARCSAQAHLMKGWTQIIEIVKLRFIGLYRCANAKAKKIEEELRKEFNLNLNIIKKKRAEIREAKVQISALKKSKVANRDSHCCKTLSLIQAWSSPRLCTGLTCGEHKGPWSTFIHHKPFWIPLQHKGCARCGRQKAAARKSLLALEGLKIRLLDRSNLDDIVKKYTMWDLTKDLTKSKGVLNLFFDSLNASPSQKRTRRKVFINIPTNDRIAILIFCRELGVRSFDGWQERDIRLVNSIQNREISESSLEFVCINCKNPLEDTQADSSSESSLGSSGVSTCCLGCRLMLACKFGIENIKRALDNVDDLDKKIAEDSGPELALDSNCESTDSGLKLSSKILHRMGLASEGTISQDTLQQILSKKGQPLSSVIMECLVKIIEDSAPNNRLFLADSMELENIIQRSDECQFSSLKDAFGDSWAKGKRDGLYILPLFSGISRSGTWCMVVVLKGKDSKRAWKLGPAMAFKSNFGIKCINAINNAFCGRSGKLIWMECPQPPIFEAESGARVILTMIVCGSALKHNISLTDAWDKLGLINSKDGKTLANTSREWALKLAINQRKCWEEMGELLADNSGSTDCSYGNESSTMAHNTQKKARDPRSRAYRKKRKLINEKTA